MELTRATVPHTRSNLYKTMLFCFSSAHTHRTRVPPSSSSSSQRIDLHFLRLKTGPLLSIRGCLRLQRSHLHRSPPTAFPAFSRTLQSRCVDATTVHNACDVTDKHPFSAPLSQTAVSFHTKTNQFCTFRLFRIALIHLTCCRRLWRVLFNGFFYFSGFFLLALCPDLSTNS